MVFRCCHIRILADFPFCLPVHCLLHAVTDNEAVHNSTRNTGTSVKVSCKTAFTDITKKGTSAYSLEFRSSTLKTNIRTLMIIVCSVKNFS